MELLIWIIIGGVLASFGAYIDIKKASDLKDHARRTRVDWYPKPNKDGSVTYIEVSNLTRAQLEVYLEDIKSNDNTKRTTSP